MRIAKIDLYQVDLPYSGGVYALSGGRTYESFDASIVRITCDDGTEGWGESTPFGSTYVAAHAAGVRAGVAELAPALLGRDPRAVDRIGDVMDDVLVGHPHAKTPLDVACWDAFGKSVGLPVCALLGGSWDVPMPMISSIHAGEPEEMRRRVADHRARGYRGHSIKIGALDGEGGPALDAERIAACLADRRAGEYFVVDANCGLLPETALRMIRLLPEGLDFTLEAPCATWRETASLRRRCPVPIVVDELAQADGDLAHLVAADVADGIGLKISKAGGLTPSRRHRDLCRAAGLTASVQDTVGSDIAFATILHLGATVPPRLLRCVLNCADMVTRRTADSGARIIGGRVLPGTAPGLGIEVDREVLGAPIASWGG
ncbi:MULTISPECIES: mandelate racemase/muconate lactonizing enzyme family protein [unclassified Saccharopolyspora]|uniref:mandelate racemase/muconate lactonizing enzyme family protein n=1 Tax=unclassified Saccharopolyspora TaxID=2646250 RepID=UPI001CD5F5C9|nr:MULTISPECIES: mandelate racemase/muconate lactonizing enzyme family protein [unclassified Saccharopolyspora]MCA1184927.1 mandelate racemase/muconate lactonizing enzyme family protein [Saccharopolyspora sp. 6T]MCA1190648.1 mandelate racemase/muconate lactonizing enzyme family protein [Saccharopolyspora sp. 6V]MCA1229115.1 mandelate racemase/muconate lactonizing enzyme family protein [Saccharopolyspora sp. 6M]MCA1279907.1 mandelate racemase/muconate lactonizing enzyme family protein [Saccharop